MAKNVEQSKKQLITELLAWCKQHNTYIRSRDLRGRWVKIELADQRITTVFSLTWQGQSYELVDTASASTRGYRLHRPRCIHTSF